MFFPGLVEELHTLNIHLHFYWSRAFIFLFPYFEYCDLSIGSLTVAPGHCLIFFPQEEKQSLLCTAFFSFIQQSLLRLSSSFLGRWIFLNISISPDDNGYRTGSFSVSLISQILSCSAHCQHVGPSFSLLTLTEGLELLSRVWTFLSNYIIIVHISLYFKTL